MFDEYDTLGAAAAVMRRLTLSADWPFALRRLFWVSRYVKALRICSRESGLVSRDMS